MRDQRRGIEACIFLTVDCRQKWRYASYRPVKIGSEPGIRKRPVKIRVRRNQAETKQDASLRATNFTIAPPRCPLVFSTRGSSAARSGKKHLIRDQFHNWPFSARKLDKRPVFLAELLCCALFFSSATPLRARVATFHMSFKEIVMKVDFSLRKKSRLVRLLWVLGIGELAMVLSAAILLVIVLFIMRK